MASFGPLGHRNAIRIVYPESRREEVSRDYVVDQVVKRILCLEPKDLLCLMSFERRGTYELTFPSGVLWAKAALALRNSVSDPALGEVTFEFCGDRHLVVVQVFNPYITEEDLFLFLSRYSLGKSGCSRGSKIFDGHGIWTGKWRFFVDFKLERGALVLPPRSFSLGPNRGRLFIPGLPEAMSCWTCGVVGHESKDCKVVKCHKCFQFGHIAKDCEQAKTCDLCGGSSHLFRACPQRKKDSRGAKKSYAAVLVSGNSTEGVVVPAKTSGPGVLGSEQPASVAVACAQAGPHGSQDGGFGTKDLVVDFLQVEKQVADWAEGSAPCEEEMETAAVVVPRPKRPLRDGSEDGGGRRPRTGAEVPLPASPPERAEVKEVVEEASEASGLPTPAKDQGWTERRLMEVLGLDSSSGSQASPARVAGPRGAPRMYCAQCGWGNHEAEKCPHMPRNKPAGLKPGEVWCEVCGETGHIDFHCPELRERYKDTFKQMEEPDFKGFGF